MALGPGGAGWSRGTIVVDRYRLEDEIGRGGFGAVHRATRLADGVPVALKVLTHGAMLHDDTAARFRREAELAMRLTHPSTIRVLDTGHTQHGAPFIAFELLQGRSLESVLAAGPLSEERALEVAEALLGSLEEAHRLGIVHRDIKPANIFLCNRTDVAPPPTGDPGGAVKLLDFGVAKEVISNEMGVTAEGIMIGTPAYMSPEQIGSKPVAAATDLYAVALVFAEMLTGKAVYDGAPLVVCMEKVRGLPAPFDPRLQAFGFFEVIERATRMNPAERPSSAADMLRALTGRRSARGSHPHAPGASSASAPPPSPAAPAARRPAGGGTAIMMMPIVVDPRPQAAQVVVQPGRASQLPDVYGDTHGISTPQGVAALRAQLGPPSPSHPMPVAPAPPAPSAYPYPPPVAVPVPPTLVRSRRQGPPLALLVGLGLLLAALGATAVWLWLSRR